MWHHWMGGVSENASLVLVPVRVRLVNVQSPRLSLDRVPDQLDTERVELRVVDVGGPLLEGGEGVGQTE